MFDNAFRERTAARTMTALNNDLDSWRDVDGGWFDGTVASVDRRIAQASSLLHRLHQAGITGYGSVSELTADRESLGELRISMLNGHQDRSTFVTPQAHDVQHQMNMVAARAFVRENIEAAHVPEELAERARRYASLHEPRADADAFAATCLRVASQIPQQKTASGPQTFEDFDDQHLFL